MRVRLVLALVIALHGGGPGLVQAAPKARAKAGAVKAGAVIDVRVPGQVWIHWTRGLVLARGAAAGDIRAPSAAIARVAAWRKAMEQARARLDTEVRTLRLGPNTVADLIGKDARAAERLARALERALEIDVTHGSDGSVVVTAGVALEAVRLAMIGPPRPAPAGHGRATAVIVDARKVLSGPALGLALVTPRGNRAGPTLFYGSMRAARADARLGDSVVEARATGLITSPAGPALELAAPAKGLDSLDSALETGALVVIVIGKKT